MAKKRITKKIKSETFKVWLVVEKRTEYSDGTEVFEDLPEPTESAGEFSTLEDTEEQINTIHEFYAGDFKK
jgi:hypothetical protein